MTPKQKKVSLNAAILRTITGNIGQLSHCLSNLREANVPANLEEPDITEYLDIRDKLQSIRQELQELEPRFRVFANFDPEPKWKRKIRKSDPDWANQIFGERDDP